MEMGERIKMLREQRGMTLEELGNKVGVGKSTVRKWETGAIANMRRDKIQKLADALGVSPGYLMGWDDAVPTSGQQTGYYDLETAKAAQEMLDDPDLHALMDAARDARPEYVKSAIQLLKTLKETNPDG